MVTGWPASGSLMYCVRSNDPANVNSYIEVDFKMSGRLNKCSRHFFSAGGSNIQRKKQPIQAAFVSGKRDSDPRPQPWQGCALPTELFPQLSLLAYPPLVLH